MDCGTVHSSGTYIGVVGNSLILNWTYSSTKSPTEVTILVGQQNKTNLLKIWTIKLSDDKPIWKETEIDSGLPEAIFNKNTTIESEGRTNFSLTIKSVPANVEEFRFVCKVAEDVWSVAAQSQITVKLASESIFAHFSFVFDAIFGNEVLGLLKKAFVARIVAYFDPLPLLRHTMRTISKVQLAYTNDIAMIYHEKFSAFTENIVHYRPG